MAYCNEQIWGITQELGDYSNTEPLTGNDRARPAVLPGEHTAYGPEGRR